MDELKLGAVVRRGSRGATVRRVQEWLGLHGFHVAIDEKFGPATEVAVGRFQAKKGLEESGVVDEETFAEFVAPMARASQPIEANGRGLGKLIAAYAQQHFRERPREIGGQNRGPWVRLYMDGNEGEPWAWCAGFVSFLLRQACTSLEISLPIAPSFSCDTLAASAKVKGMFVGEAGAIGAIVPGALFLSRRTSCDWVHTGIVLRAADEVFETIEGNTNDDGSREGYEVCQRFRGYVKKDFIVFA